MSRSARLSLRCLALGYLFVLLLAPLGAVFFHTFEHGLAPVISSLSSANATHALVLTLELVAIAVPANTVFGIAAALWLVRGRSRARRWVSLVIDLPFALSPVVIGLSLLLVYGAQGWLGGFLSRHGVQIAFSLPGMALATIFVSLPFVARECVPVLEQIGTEAEQAAATLGADAWQTFRRVTLPAIRWAVAYGVVLATARALGEFGAVSVISGRIVGQTESLPLLVQDRYESFDTTGAYSAAALLAILALAVLLGLNLLSRHRRGAFS